MTDNNKIHSLGLGIGSKNSKGQWLEVYFPQPFAQVDPEIYNALDYAIQWDHSKTTFELSDLQIREIHTVLAPLQNRHPEATILMEQAVALLKCTQQPVLVVHQTDGPSPDVPSIYLKLHLLSHRLVKPHGVNLEGIFAKLPNVAWTNWGAIDIDELPKAKLKAREKGKSLRVFSVDKFPKMTDYVVPKGVRIGDCSRVRLGAYLGEGTTVMHEGFVNFNAGTEGPNMVEGRISAGVFVGAGSDLGGGCSTMGTLSGGNQQVISVGKDCLIGANAGLGIPLGDRCTIEAGLYLTAASKVTLLDKAGQEGGVVKAANLAGQSDLLFRRNSLNGRIECLTNKAAIELNKELHDNN